MSEQIVLLYDPVKRRPACALLQAVAGCDNLALSALFPAETWIVDGDLSGLRRIAGTREQWERAAKLKPIDAAKRPARKRKK